MLAATGCVLDSSPSGTPPASIPAASASATSRPATDAPSQPGTAGPSPDASPTATAEPALSLDLPETLDDRVVGVEVVPDVGDGGGTLLVRITSRADTRIDELVLRWSTDLADQLFLAPFEPSDERIREGGPPLVQPWTKWVIGPGERGEPDGTTSLGWGPLLARTTLEIPVLVTRRADGPVAFDLQVLAGNDILTLPDGEPAELRVEVP
jgi:hypothetical protein